MMLIESTTNAKEFWVIVIFIVIMINEERKKGFIAKRQLYPFPIYPLKKIKNDSDFEYKYTSVPGVMVSANTTAGTIKIIIFWSMTKKIQIKFDNELRYFIVLSKIPGTLKKHWNTSGNKINSAVT